MVGIATTIPHRHAELAFRSSAPVGIRRRAGALLFVAAFFSILSLPETAVGQAVTITAIDDFTEFPTAKRTVDVTATGGGGTLRYRVEAVGRLPYGIRVEPTDLTDLVSGTSKVTITNPGRRIVVVNVRVIVTDGTNSAQEDFKAVFHDNVAPFEKPTLKARSGDGAVELTWSHAGRQRVTGYQYKQGSGAWTAVPGSNADTVSHVVTGLANATEYTFQVRALNALGMSPAADAVAVTPAALPDNVRLSNLQARVDRNWVTLSWDRPSAGVGADIRYRYQVNDGAIQDIPGSDATTTSYTWELLPGSHKIAIWAENVKANFGGTVLFPRVSVAGPSAPAGLRAEVGDGEVTLRWRRSPDGRIGVYEYQVDDGEWSVARGVPGNGTEFRITGLTNKREYTFGLRARGDWYGLANSNYGYGPFAEVRATPNQLLPAPTGLAVKAGTEALTSFAVQWNAVPNATGYVATATLSGRTITSGTVSGTEAAFAGLNPSTEYTVSVRATISSPDYHPTGRAATLAVSTLPPLPRVPDGLSLEAGNARVTLRWTQATDRSIRGYEYRYRTDSEFQNDWVRIPNSDATTASHTVTGLTGGIVHVFLLRAVNVSGAGEATPNVLRVVPLGGPVPGAPENVRAEAVPSDRHIEAGQTVEVPGGRRIEPGNSVDLGGLVRLSWMPPRSPDTSVTGYEYTLDGRLTWVPIPDRNDYLVSGLNRGQEYTFQLRAVNVHGAGAPSAVVMATPDLAPGAPENLRTEVGDRQVALTWEAPTSGGRIDRYQLWHTGAEIWTDIAGSDAMTTRHVVTHLIAGQSYRFRVRATNEAGAGQPTQEVDAVLRVLNIADASVDEGASGSANMIFTVTLMPQGSGQVTVNYATANGTATVSDSDYANTTGTLTFAANEISETITVQVNGDGVTENNESFTVSLSSPSGATLQDGKAVGIIVDDDRVIRISPISDFTEFPTASRRIAVTATGGSGTLQYQVEAVGRLPYGIRVEPTDLTDLVSGSGEVTITNPGRRIVVVNVRVIVADGGTNRSTEEFKAVFHDNVAPFVKPVLEARAGKESVGLTWSHAGGQRVTGYEYKQDNGAWTAVPDSHVDTTSHVVTGLANGTSYTFQVRALNALGIGPASNVVTETPVAVLTVFPSSGISPDLRATVNRNQVTLSWDRPTVGVGADLRYEYIVYTLGRPYVPIPGSNADTTSFTLEFEASNYGIYVGATSGNTVIPGLISATFEIQGPGSPEGLRAEAGDGEVTLRWTRVRDHTIRPAKVPVIYEYQINGGRWLDAGISGTAREFRITGLTNNQEYTFGLRAMGDPRSPDSAQRQYGYGASARTTATPNPFFPAPTGLDVVLGSQDEDSFKVQWDPVPDATGYVVTVLNFDPNFDRDIETTFPITATETGTLNTLANTVFTVSVRATTDDPNYLPTGRAATLVTRTTPPLPRTPDGLSLEAGNARVTLRWTQATDRSIRGYEYRYRTDSEFQNDWVRIPDSDATTVSHTVTGLTGGIAHVFILRAVNASGAGEATPNVLRVVPLGGPVPRAPENVRAEVVPSGLHIEAGQAVDVPGGRRIELGNAVDLGGLVRLSWMPPRLRGKDDYEPDTSVTGYEYTLDGGLTWVPIPDRNDYLVTGLTKGQSYTFRVRAVSARGRGRASGPVTVMPDNPPGVTANLRAEVGDRQVTLTWEVPTSGGRIDGYQLWRTGAEIWTDIAGSDAMTTRHVVTHLIAGQSYRFRVRATNEAGAGLPTQEVDAVLRVLNIADASVDEGASGSADMIFTVTLMPPSSGQVTVNYATANGTATVDNSDYANTTGTLTFAANEISETITVQVNGDGVTENNESFTVSLSSPSGATLQDGKAVGIIVDDDRVIRISPISDFTEFPTASRRIAVTATGGSGTLQYQVEAVGRLPYGIRMEPTDLTDLVSGSGEVTIMNPGRRIVVVNVRVIVADGGTNRSTEEFKAVFHDNVAPFVKPVLEARAGNESVELIWSHAGRQRVTNYQYKQGDGVWTAVPDSHVDTTSHVVAGLANGTSHTFQVRALNAQGIGPASDAVSATPAVPPSRHPVVSNLQARVDRNWVTVSWDRPTVGVGTDLNYQYRVGGVHQSLIPVPNSDATTTSFAVELLPGTYNIFLRAQTSASGLPGRAATVSPSPTVLGPAAPADFRADVGDGEVTLRWTRTTDKRVGLYEYQINGGRWLEAGIPRGAKELRFTGLTNGQEYTFGLRALGDPRSPSSEQNEYGHGPAAEMTVVPNPLLPAPTGLELVSGSQDDDSFEVRWNAVADVTGYVATAASSGVATASGMVTDTEAAFTSLTASTTYTVSVRVTNDDPNYQSTGQAATLVVQTSPPLPRVPDGLSLEAGKASVTLRWTQATDRSIRGYEYRYRTGSEFRHGWVRIPDRDATTASHTVTRLTGGIVHVFILRAVNASGAGEATPNVLRVVPLGGPGAPENVRAEAVPSGLHIEAGQTVDLGGLVRLSWMPPRLPGKADYEPDTSVTGYEYTLDGELTWVPILDRNDYLVTGLTKGQSYTFRVRAVNAGGPGRASGPVTVTPDDPPGATTNLRAEVGDGWVRLRWDPPTSGGGTNRYQLWRGETEVWEDLERTTSASTSHRVTGLNNGQVYTFRVRAANDAGVGRPTQEVSATPVGGKLATPSIYAVVGGDASLRVVWTSVSGSGIVVGYGVEYREAGTLTWTQATGSIGRIGRTDRQRLDVTGLTNDTSYEVRVRALALMDSGEDSDWSSLATGTPGTDVMLGYGGIPGRLEYRRQIQPMSPVITNLDTDTVPRYREGTPLPFGLTLGSNGVIFGSPIRLDSDRRETRIELIDKDDATVASFTIDFPPVEPAVLPPPSGLDVVSDSLSPTGVGLRWDSLGFRAGDGNRFRVRFIRRSDSRVQVDYTLAGTLVFFENILQGGTAYTVLLNTVAESSNYRSDGTQISLNFSTPRVTRPRVRSVAVRSIPAENGTFRVGEALDVGVLFTARVAITGTPRLALDLDSGRRYAESVGAGTVNRFGSILFRYIVQPGDFDNDGISIPANALELNGGTIGHRTDRGASAILTHAEVAVDSRRRVDGREVDTTGRAAAPENVMAVAGDGQVTLSWDAYTGASADGFEYRMDDGSIWVLIPGSGTTTTRHEVTGLDNGPSYTFRVRAVVAGVGGLASSSVTAMPAATGELMTPVVSVLEGNASLTVTWAAVTAAETYRVEYREATAQSWTQATGSPTTPALGVDLRQLSIGSLTNGTAYEVRVSAEPSSVSGRMNSDWSRTATGTPTTDVTLDVIGVPQRLQVGVGITGIVVQARNAPSNTTLSYALAEGASLPAGLSLATMATNFGVIEGRPTRLNTARASVPIILTGTSGGVTTTLARTTIDFPPVTLRPLPTPTGLALEPGTLTSSGFTVVWDDVNLPLGMNYMLSVIRQSDSEVVLSYLSGRGPPQDRIRIRDALQGGVAYAVQLRVVGNLDGYEPKGALLTLDVTTSDPPSAPRVRAIAFGNTPAANETYGIGETVEVDVAFDAPVVYTGSPRVELAIGGGTRYAHAEPASGGGGGVINVMSFYYTVQSTDFDDNGISIAANALDLNGGTIRHHLPTVVLRDAVLTHSAVDADLSRKVDGSILKTPRVLRVSIDGGPAVGDTYGFGETIEVVAEFSIPIAYTGTPRIGVAIGSEMREALAVGVSPSSRGSIMRFHYRVQAGDRDADGISVPADGLIRNLRLISHSADPETRANLKHRGLADDLSRKVDGSQVGTPGVVRVSIAGAPVEGDTYQLGETIEAVVEFNLPVSVTGAPRLGLTLQNAVRPMEVALGTSGRFLHFFYTVQSDDRDTDGLSIAANALMLNGGTIVRTEATGTAAVLTHAAVSPGSGRKVDGTQVGMPSVVGVSFVGSPANDAYHLGEMIETVVEFNLPVRVTGTPQLGLTIGDQVRQMNVMPGAAGRFLHFRHRVLSGDLDRDGVSIAANALRLNGGAITHLADGTVNAVLTHAAVSTDSEHRVSFLNMSTAVEGFSFNTAPLSGEDTYGFDETIEVVAVFSSPVAYSGTPRLGLTIGDNTRYAQADRVRDDYFLYFRYTVQASDSDASGISIAANAFDLPIGAAITHRDSTTLNANLTHEALATDPRQKVDGSQTFEPPVTAPGVSIISFATSPASGDTYKRDESIEVVVGFDAPIAYGGTPRLGLTIGGETRYAEAYSLSNELFLYFRYRVQASDSDTDGISIAANAFDLPSGAEITNRDDTTLDADLTHAAAATDAGRKVDGSQVIPPSVAIVALASTAGADRTYTFGNNIWVAAGFDQAVAVTGVPRLGLTIGTETRYAQYRGLNGTYLYFRYTVQDGDSDTDGISIATNALDLPVGATITHPEETGTAAVLTHAALADNPAHRVDGTAPPPTVSVPAVHQVAIITQPKEDNTFKLTEDICVSVGFDAAVATEGAPEITLNIGGEERTATLDYAIDNSLVFCYEVQSSDSDTDGVSIAANAIKTSAGNTITHSTDPSIDAILTHAAVEADASRKVDGSDLAPPRVTSIGFVNLPAAGNSYAADEKILIAAGFDDSIVFTGTPQVAVQIGSETRQADIDLAEVARLRPFDTTRLIFSYTVQSGDSDTGGISIAANALSLNGGTITAPDSTVGAVLTHAAVVADASRKVGTANRSPVAASDLSVSSGNGQLVVSWTAATHAPNGYSVRWRIRGSNAALSALNTVSGTTYTITGLTNGTTYDVQVDTRNAANDGIEVGTDIAGFGTPEVLPTVPRSLQVAAAAAAGELEVRWQAAESEPNDYLIRWREAGEREFPEDNSREISGQDDPAMQYRERIEDLKTDGTGYLVRVDTLDADGRVASNASASGSATPLPLLSVATDSVLRVTEGGVDATIRVVLSYALTEAVTVNYATADVSTVAGDYTATTGILTFAASETSKTVTVAITDDNVDEIDETFELRLSGPTNGAFLLLEAQRTPVTILDDEVGTAVAPTNLEAVAGNASVTLRWMPVADSSITSYEYSQDNGAWVPIAGSDLTTSSHTVTGLTNGQSYAFRMRAAIGATGGAASSSVSATPVEMSLRYSPIPTTLTVGVAVPVINPTSAGLTGTVSYSVSSGALPRGVTLRANGSIRGTPTTANVVATVATVTASSGARSATADITFPAVGQGTLPAPANLREKAGAVTRTSLTVLWNSVAEARGYTAVATKVSDTSVTVTGTVTDLEASFSGLEMETEYMISVQAVGDDVNYAVMGRTATLQLTTAPPKLRYLPVPAELAVGVPISRMMPVVENVAGTVSYAVSSGILPVGLTLDSTQGIISGTPRAASTVMATVTVTASTSGRNAMVDITFPAVMQGELRAPGGLKVRPGTLSGTGFTVDWSAVSRATGYEAVATKVGDTSTTVPGTVALGATTATFSGLEEGTSYTVSVLATGDGTNYEAKGSAATLAVTTESAPQRKPIATFDTNSGVLTIRGLVLTQAHLDRTARRVSYLSLRGLPDAGARDRTSLSWTAGGVTRVYSASTTCDSALCRWVVPYGNLPPVGTGTLRARFTGAHQISSDFTLGFIRLGQREDYDAVFGTSFDTQVHYGIVPVTVSARMPVAPEGLRAQAGNAQVTLSWADPGNSSITGYEYSTDGGGTWEVIANGGSGTTSHVVSGLTNYQKYTFWVRAVNAQGNGASAAVSGVPAWVPRLKNLRVAPGDATASLWWDALQGQNLRYEYTQDGGASWQSSATPTRPRVQITGLTNGRAYTFRVRAMSSGASGSASRAVTVIPGPLPVAPKGLEATRGDGTVTLNWSAPDTPEPWVTKYQYWWRTFWIDVPQSGPATRSVTLTGVDNGTDLEIRVRAVAGLSDTGQPRAGLPSVSVDVPGEREIDIVVRRLAATPEDGQVELRWLDPGAVFVDSPPVLAWRASSVFNAIVNENGEDIGVEFLDLVDSFEVSQDGGNTWGPVSGIRGGLVAIRSGPVVFRSDGRPMNEMLPKTGNEPDYWRTFTVTSLANDTTYQFGIRAVRGAVRGPAAWVTATPVGSGEEVLPTLAVRTDPTEVDGGARVILRAMGTVLDSGTFRWTASPNVGEFGVESHLQTFWAAPVATMSEQTVTLTLMATIAGSPDKTISVSAPVTVRALVPPLSNQVPVITAPTEQARDMVMHGPPLEVPVLATDQDGEALTYWASSSDDAVVTVTPGEAVDFASGSSVVRVTQQGAGAATVTVSVSDGIAVVTKSFAVTVLARDLAAPQNLAASLRLLARDPSMSSVEVTWDAVFGAEVYVVAVARSDGIGQTLEEMMTGTTATFEGLAGGTDYTVSVQAQSDGTLYETAGEVAAILITTNSPPTFRSGIISLPQLDYGELTDVDVSTGFSDPEGDSLTYTATSSDMSLIEVREVNGSLVTLLGRGSGTATITVMADDGRGGTVEGSFDVTVRLTAPSVTLTQSARRQITVSWPDVPGATSYTLQWKLATVTSWDAPDVTTISEATSAYVIDNLMEAQVYDVRVQALPSSGQGTWSTVVQGTPVRPTLSISPTSVSVLEGVSGSSASQTFTVLLNLAGTGLVRVAYATADGTGTDAAAAGTDYMSTSGTLTFAVGETSKNIVVQIIGDAVDEIDETFTVALSNPVGSDASISPTAGTATVTITDDDRARLSIGDSSVVEGNSGPADMQFTVTLSRVSARDVTVDYATADVIGADAATAGTDYTSTSGTLTFAAGTTTQTFNVLIAGDVIHEVDETFTVTLSRPSNANLEDDEATGTISNDEVMPTLSFAPDSVSVLEGAGGSTEAAVFTVMLSPASDQQVTVDYATADGAGAGAATEGTDYTEATGTLTFAAGETRKTFTAQVAGDDGTDEGDETFTVSLSNQIGNASISTTAGTATATITELPALSIADARVEEGDSGTVNMEFTLTLNKAAAGSQVTVDYTIIDASATAGTDYTSAAGTLTFAEDTTELTFGVLIAGDEIYEEDETFTVILSDPAGARLADGVAAGTITNDEDAPMLSIVSGDRSVLEGGQGSTTMSVFTVVMNLASSQQVTVGYVTADGTGTDAATEGSDYTAATGTLTFAAGETTQIFTVLVLGDVIVEPDEIFTVSLTNASGSNASISQTEGTATVTISESLAVSIADASVEEGDNGTVNMEFTVMLNGVGRQQATVDYATADGTAMVGSDYVATRGTLTFAAGTTELTQTFNVLIAGDVIYEGDETFTVTLSNPVNANLADGVATGTITENEPEPMLGIEDTDGDEGYSAIFTVTMVPASSQPVTVDYVTGQDGTGTDPAMEGVDYTATSGTLTFAPGETSKTFTVQVSRDRDDDGERDETFRVTLRDPSGSNAMLARRPDGTTGMATGTINAIPKTPRVDGIVIAPPDGNSYKRGDEIEVRVEFNIEVGYEGRPLIELSFDDGSSGNLTLSDDANRLVAAQQEDGSTREALLCVDNQQSSNELRFCYQVQADDISDGIGIVENSLNLNGGRIFSSLDPDRDAVLGHPVVRPDVPVIVEGNVEPGLTDERLQDLIEEVESRSALAIVDDVIRTISQRIRDVGTPGQATLSIAGHEVRLDDLQAQEKLSEMRDLNRLGEEETYTDLKPTTERLFDGTSFVIPLQLHAGAGDAAQMEVWGRGSWQSMDDEGDRLDWDGDRRGAQLGIDGQFREDVLGGLVVSWSDGDFDYRDGNQAGSYENRMLSVHPWIAWSTNEDMDLWASAGYGDGEITISEENFKSDTTLQTLAAGASGSLLEQDALTVVLKGEGFFAKVDVDEGGVSDVDANRMRLAVEGSWAHGTDSGGKLTPSLELGMRADGGDGSSGTGAEIGAGVVFVDHTGRLSLDLDSRILVTDGDVLERGLSGVLRYAPDSAGRGLSLDVRSSWGAASSGMERLWETGVSDMAEGGLQTALGGRMHAEIGYGIGYASGLLKSYGGIELEGDGNARYLVGSRYTTSSSLQLSFEGTHRAEDSESGIMLKGTLRW